MNMETVIQSHQSAQFVHPVYNPGAAGICPEMLEVAEEANRAGDYDLAAEIYSSQLADLQHPDRGLCLRKADALAQTGRIAEALDSYCTAANIGELRPGELQLLVENIARTLREKELTLNINSKATSSHISGNGNDGVEADGTFEEEPLDLFSCRLCRCLLSEPTTLECGHTFCKHCLEDETVKDCIQCKHKLNKKDGQIMSVGFRVNVILSSLLDKCFDSESKARRHWIEGEVSRKKHDYTDALDKYNKAVELAPSIGRLLGQRAELHVDSRNYSQAIQDAESLCRLKPLCPKAHHIKASALSKANYNDEALKEYFMCVALKPDWMTVKLEAQKLLSELFSSAFEKDGQPTPLHPLQGGPSTRRLKPPALLSSLHPLTTRQRPGCSSQDPAFSASKSSPREGPPYSSKHPLSPSSEAEKPLLEDAKSLASVLAALPAPPGGLKRRHSGDSPAFNTPSKLPRPDEAYSSSHPPAASPGRRTVAADLLDSRDMECSLCMRLFYEPVTTPCGHTFCLKCLERSLDHNPNCPLCKENLSEYLATRGYNKTLLMEEVLQRYLGDELAERKKIHEEEMKELSNLNQEVPIFVCTMAFPTIPCPLHVFEPCYRLMIRRSMETGTKRFGMCIADELKGFADYGCMLEVRDVKFFPDGRSVVDTIGVSRFKVLSHGQRDGYNTAKIEYLEDKKVEGQELAELQKLYVSVYDQASGWFTSLKDNMKSQIISHFGHLPGKDPDPQSNPSGPAWAWWLLAVLPLDNRAQLTILAMPFLKDRLIAIRRVLIFVTRKRPR
ncbi:LON peptidase N-terminal domain and RING finger protein 2 [Salmo salar]|uniref:LON peptidase N-terminal domain and RING finger protein 2 n=1 Tax=Salmo salar TaxID=8030 RepID=A0A1S3PNQ3_SALSA|nr:LON peptidase N-terminal domain and RING finger protein 2 [Salmo salar]